MYLKTKFGLFGYFIVLISPRLGLDCLIGEFDLQIFLSQVFWSMFLFFCFSEFKDGMLLYWYSNRPHITLQYWLGEWQLGSSLVLVHPLNWLQFTLMVVNLHINEQYSIKQLPHLYDFFFLHSTDSHIQVISCVISISSHTEAYSISIWLPEATVSSLFLEHSYLPVSLIFQSSGT